MLAAQGGYGDLAGRGRLQHRRAGLEAVDLRRGDEVGPAQPQLPVLPGGVVVGDGQPRQGAGARQRDRAARRAVGIVQVDLGDGVPAAQQDERRPRPVQVPDGVQHRIRVLGDQLTPVRAIGRRGVGDGEPPPGGAVGGEQVEQALVHPGAALDVVGLGEDGHQRGVTLQVCDPQGVAPGGADVAGDQQPAPVAAHADVVIGVLVVEAGAVDEGVAAADAVPPDPPVEGLLAVRCLGGVDHPDVEELLPAGEPGHGRVAAAVDRRLDLVAAVDVEHVQHRVLVPARGELVGDAAALAVGQPRVERGETGRIDRHRVEERTAVDEHDGVLLAGFAAGAEPAARPPRRGADRSGVQQVLEPLRQVPSAGECLQVCRGERVLLGRPRDRPRIGGILEPPVGIGDPVTVQVLDEVEPRGVGVAHALRG